MRVMFALLAEAVNRTESQTMNILGEFNMLYSDAFPFVRPTIAGFVRLQPDPDDPNEILLGLDLIAERDSAKLWESRSVTIPRTEKERIDVTFSAAGVVFPAPGMYRLRVLASGQEVHSVSLTVAARPPATGD